MINTSEFTTLVQQRCDLAETENDEFKKLEEKCFEAYERENLEEFFDLLLQLRCLSEEICYKKGFTDAFGCISNPYSQTVQPKLNFTANIKLE